MPKTASGFDISAYLAYILVLRIIFARTGSLLVPKAFFTFTFMFIPLHVPYHLPLIIHYFVSNYLT